MHLRNDGDFNDQVTKQLVLSLMWENSENQSTFTEVMGN